MNELEPERRQRGKVASPTDDEIIDLALATEHGGEAGDDEPRLHYFRDSDLMAFALTLLKRYGTAPAHHHDDAAVDAFAMVMKDKLATKRAEGRGGWQEATAEFLSDLLREHVEKGDPVDVANFAMMLHQNGQRIAAQAQPADHPADASKMVDEQAEFEHFLSKRGIAANYQGDGQYLVGSVQLSPPAWSGMSLRDYFAAQVIGPAFLDMFAGWRQRGEPIQENWPMWLAIDAYRVADAMIEAGGAS